MQLKATRATSLLSNGGIVSSSEEEMAFSEYIYWIHELAEHIYWIDGSAEYGQSGPILG